MVLADDRLAVAFNSGSGLKLLRALVENPMGPADFTETVIDPDGAINGAHSLASRSNELYVVYYKFNAGTGEYDSLWFARALTGNPTGPADWVRYQLAAPAYMTGYGEALAAFEEGVVWGSAATTPSSPGKAVLVVSWLADPGSSTGIGDWSQHEVAIPDASVAGACEFRLVEGTLYALMTKFSSENTGGIWLARSLSYPPEGPEDWEPFPIDNQGEFGLAQGATAIINGRFAVLYQRGSSVSRAGWIGLAGDNHPGESSIWTRKALPTDDTANTFGATVAISGGRAAIAYTADADFFSPRPTRGDLVLLRQTGADPADGSAATWVRTVVDAEGATGYQAIIGTLADGRLAIAYANLTSGRFRLAIAQGPY